MSKSRSQEVILIQIFLNWFWYLEKGILAHNKPSFYFHFEFIVYPVNEKSLMTVFIKPDNFNCKKIVFSSSEEIWGMYFQNQDSIFFWSRWEKQYCLKCTSSLMMNSSVFFYSFFQVYAKLSKTAGIMTLKPDYQRPALPKGFLGIYVRPWVLILNSSYSKVTFDILHSLNLQRCRYQKDLIQRVAFIYLLISRFFDSELIWIIQFLLLCVFLCFYVLVNCYEKLINCECWLPKFTTRLECFLRWHLVILTEKISARTIHFF